MLQILYLCRLSCSSGMSWIAAIEQGMTSCGFKPPIHCSVISCHHLGFYPNIVDVNPSREKRKEKIKQKRKIKNLDKKCVHFFTCKTCYLFWTFPRTGI